MKPNRRGKVITGTVFAFVLLFAGGTILTTTAQAQDRDRNERWQNRDRDDHRNWDQRNRNDRDRNRDWERERARERARILELERQRARERAWELQRERDRYRYSYPRQYPNYGYGGYGSSRYSWESVRNIAEQNGYRAGLDRGADDARHRRAFNVFDSGKYRDGDSGYHSEYGNKDAYRAAYREGFRRGYEQAYRQYAGYGYRR